LSLAGNNKILYNVHYRARRGGSGALYPQSAIAESNSCPRHANVRSVMCQSTMKIGSCAIRNREPRQVREEAAVSGAPGVPQARLVRVRCAWYACICIVKGRCTVLYRNKPGGRFSWFFCLAGCGRQVRFVSASNESGRKQILLSLRAEHQRSVAIS